MLMQAVLEIPFEKVITDENITLSSSLQLELDKKIDQLRNYMPIQYVLGKAHFYGREFFVNPSVLIPRQETEELINEIVIDNKQKGLKVLDIGSGSGCIGITLGLELDGAVISAMDIDGKALDVTIKNAKSLGVDLQCYLEDVLTIDQLPGHYDIIVSNPPYVTESEKNEMHNNVLEHEPEQALYVPDDNPLIFYRKIMQLAKNHLKPKGKLYFEINEHFGSEMIKLCEEEQCACLRLIHDLNGKDRFIKAMFD